MGIFRAEDEKAKEEKGRDMVAALKKEIEPLLADANPFFGGSEKMTMAEVSDLSQPLYFISWSLLNFLFHRLSRPLSSFVSMLSLPIPPFSPLLYQNSSPSSRILAGG